MIRSLNRLNFKRLSFTCLQFFRLVLLLLAVLLLSVCAPSWASLSASGYTASGSGVSAANGTFAPLTGANATYDGAQQFVYGSLYLSYTTTGNFPNAWQVTTAVNGGGNIYYVSPTSSSSSFPLTGWSTYQATGSPPSWTAAGLSAPTISSFTASSASITQGQSTTLSWVTSGATSCTISGLGSVSASSSVSVTPSATTTYTLTATNSAGSVSQSVTVTVYPPAIVQSCAASPASITSTGATTIVLTVTLNGVAPTGGAAVAVSCTGSGFAGSYGLSGSTVTVPAGTNTATINGTISVQTMPTGAASVTFTASYNGSSQSAVVTIGTAGTGSGGTTSAGAPGVSASLSPYTVSSGSASVLRWDTSGASSVTVTGVAAPSFSGTENVAPSATTTYTVTATNSSGTTTQQVTLGVGPGGQGGAGTSTFTPGTTVNNAGSTFNGTLITGITLPGATIPGYGAIPPLTLPTFTTPPITMPTLSFPGATAPGDLSIGIPGLGSIGIPSGWFTQVIAAGISPATIGIQTATMTAGQFNALATYNAGAAVQTAVNNGTYTLKQIDTVDSAQEQAVINSTATATQTAVTNGASLVQAQVQFSGQVVQQQLKDTETKSVTDFQGMLQTLLQALFIPDPSVLAQFQTEQTQFLNWGPYAFVTSFQSTLNTPAGDGSLGGVANGALPGLSLPEIGVNTDPSNYALMPTGNGSINNYNGAVTYATGQQPAVGTTLVAPGAYYATGNSIPIDVHQITLSPVWPYFRDFEGGFIYILFVGGCIVRFMPKQTF